MTLKTNEILALTDNRKVFISFCSRCDAISPNSIMTFCRTFCTKDPVGYRIMKTVGKVVANCDRH